MARNRADAAWDLVVSLLRVGQIEGGTAGHGHLRRALGILRAMQAAGRLERRRQGTLAALEERVGGELAHEFGR